MTGYLAMEEIDLCWTKTSFVLRENSKGGDINDKVSNTVGIGQNQDP
jgi:hypothetical protein